MLEIKNLCCGYPGKPVLRHLSFTAQKGTVTAVIGTNGCGKSTLLKTICGILPASSGQILLDGQDLMALPAKTLAQKTAYLAQSRQIPDITVSRLVLHGRFPYLNYPRKYRKSDYDAADKAMRQMQLSDLADTPLRQLSGGQRQKVYIAMALAQDTPILLLDEPTTYLDVSHQLQMLRTAKELANAGKYVLMVIHDLSHALETADFVAVIDRGSIAVQGTPEEVYTSRVLDQIFGVHVSRIETDTGKHYFCKERRI